MNYKIDFEKAVRKTLELDLNLYGSPLPLESSPIPEQNIFYFLRHCIPFLHQQGYFSSKDLNGNCVDVHLTVKRVLKELFGLECFITIGSMHGKGWDYCEMSYAYIRKELDEPNLQGELNAHIWLTLPDGSIVDWTGQAWYDQKAGESHDLSQCLVYFSPTYFFAEHYYKPYLVGEEFLIRTGTIGFGGVANVR